MQGAMDERLRIDKWLWAARLVKTRSLAADAVKGGRVQVNGQRAKPSKEVGPGDRIDVTIGQTRRAIVVLGVASHRRPAKEAELLYEETAESRAAREEAAAQRRLSAPPPGADLGARPTKRDRRRFESTPGARRGRR
ncbi:MAG: ribosome-associated heat shock protein Hsp15 [bacterium]|jgi:ribosome-associated heat shock protein Hsp15